MFDDHKENIASEKLLFVENFIDETSLIKEKCLLVETVLDEGKIFVCGKFP